MPKFFRRILIVGAILVSVGVVGSFLRNRLGIAFDVESVRAFAQGLGPLAPFLFVFVVAGRSLLWLPSQIVLVVAGLCLDTAVGTLVGAISVPIAFPNGRAWLRALYAPMPNASEPISDAAAEASTRSAEPAPPPDRHRG